MQENEQPDGKLDQHILPDQHLQNQDRLHQLYYQASQMQLEKQSGKNMKRKISCRNDLEAPNSPKIHTNDSEEGRKQAYSLSWKEFPFNFVSFFRELKEEGELLDVTIACDGNQISAHKVVLAASSPFFRRLLKNNPCQHPIIILNDVSFSELIPLIHYIYNGEVNIHYDEISHFLRTARLLQIRGLTGEDSETLARSISSNDHIGKGKKDVHTGNQLPEHSKKSFSPTPKRKKTSFDRTDPKLSPEPNLPASVRDSPKIESSYYNHEPLQNSSSRPTSPEVSQPIPLPPNVTPIQSIVALQHPPLMPSITSPSPFPHLMGSHYAHQFQAFQEDTSDTCVSDRSDDRPSEDHEMNDEEEKSIEDFERLSGFPNFAALKGLAGFPGPSNLIGQGIAPNSEHPQGRSRFDFFRVRATDPRPCHLCGKIYKNAHTLRTHMEDKHSNCNGFRCVLCGTVAKSRNSLHSHMSRQHRGISTKDLPLLPMPAPWNPEIASKYIQLVGGVGEVVRQNYRRPDKENCTSKEQNPEAATGSNASTPTSQNNGALSPSQKSEDERDKRAYEALTQQLNSNNVPSRPPNPSLFDTYLHMMRASGMDLMRQDYRYMQHFRDPIDLARNTTSPASVNENESKVMIHMNDNGLPDDSDEKSNGRARSGSASAFTNNTCENDEGKWAAT